jgi:methionyl-tRNA formyltransferase
METLPRSVAGAITAQPQDESQATITKLVQKEDGELDWQLTAQELWRRVRAYQPWPGCFTLWQGRLLKVLEAVPLAQESGEPPGTVLALHQAKPGSEVNGAAVGVQTGRGVLGLLRVHPEGRRVTTGPEFVRGQRDFIGNLLPSPPSLTQRES